MIIYVETSAALKLVIEEPESPHVAEWIEKHLTAGDQLVSSFLLFPEMHCAADRRRTIDPDSVTAVLESFDLVDLRRDDLRLAGVARWGLRSADAIHLANALRIGADTFLTYDEELKDAAARAGLRIDSPGSG